jgi:type II secretory pathway component PulJ
MAKMNSPVISSAKSNYRMFVRCTPQPFAVVTLSAAKNLAARPFAALRVTVLVCQSFVTRFSDQHLAWHWSGVTVIEVVVAMGVASLFSAALYGFYWLHMRVLRVAEARLNVQESSRLAVDFLLRELRFAGARPVRGGPCDGFERLTVTEEQQVTLQYDFRGNRTGAPPDGCPDDPSEVVTYAYDSDAQILTRATGGGAPQPLINSVPPDGFRLHYFDSDGNELFPALDEAERAAVSTIAVTVRVSEPHPDPRELSPITSELSSTVFLPNPAR